MDVIYWETTIETTINNDRKLDGMMIAHSGLLVINILKFGECSINHTRTIMEETWTIDDVVFNVLHLSMDCFIPLANIIKTGSGGDACNYQSNGKPVPRKLGNGMSQQVLLGDQNVRINEWR